jgi:hypothetical protein
VTVRRLPAGLGDPVDDFMAGLARVVIRFRYVVIAGWLIAAALWRRSR